MDEKNISEELQNNEFQEESQAEEAEESEELLQENLEAPEEALQDEFSEEAEEYEETRASFILNKIKDFLQNKRLVGKALAIALAFVLLIQIITSSLINSAAFGKDNLKNSEKANDIISTSILKKEDASFLQGKAESTFIDGEKGHKLHALTIKNKTNSYIIACHPITADSGIMASYARHFYDMGFTVILPDARGCGQSDYKNISLGLYDSEDILKWISFILKDNKDADIFLFGVGMGASTCLMTSDKNLPKNVKGIISDSGYSDIKESLKENIKDIYGVPAFPTVSLMSLNNKIFRGWSFGDIDVKSHVKNSTVPILFIHCVEDEIVPIGQSNDLFELCDVKGTDHIRITGATHAQGINKNPDKYWQNVDKFIVSNLEF